MTDWDAIERDWRFTDKSTRALAREYEVSEGAIRKRAKSEGWEKGEQAKPRQPIPPKEDRQTIVVPPRADSQATVEPMDKTIELAERMLGELDATSMMLDEIEDLIYQETEDDRDPRRRNAMLKAVSLPTRATTLKTIQQTLAAAKESQKPSGKKAEREEQAKGVAQNTTRFAAPKAPHLVVSNK